MNHILIPFSNYKKAVRAISFQTRMPSARPIFTDLKLLKSPEIFELRLLTFVFNSVKKTSPSCFRDFSCSVLLFMNTRQDMPVR